ncbi:MAG TPA: alpha-2-macroglobulin, partial [Planctomycetaceae bacterium]|nr:alpha-2-macroglobulin [Planctomycetaceae bacterium]
IAGGSNVPDIKEFFWKWLRRHWPHAETNLSRPCYNLLCPREEPMRDIGIFGYSVPEETVTDQYGVRKTLSAVGTEAKGAGPRLMARPRAAAPVPVAEEAEARAAPAPTNAVQPAIRKEFADTALWVPDIEVRPDGTAELSFKMPENLTTWKARLWCMGHGTRVAEVTLELLTRKNLMVRLITPRFLVERDHATISAIVHNYLEGDKEVRVTLDVQGEALKLAGSNERRVRVPAGGQARLEWQAIAVAEGQATLTVKALTDEESDALQRQLPITVHGILKTEAWSGAIEPNGRAASTAFSVPAERRPELSRLELRWSPSIAAALVDALPYLLDYPYGCTEQTLNRFLPAVIVQKALIEMGIDLEAVR